MANTVAKTQHPKKKYKPAQQHIGLAGLTIAAFSSMLGSGWLFSSWRAAQLAGPASILAWPIGAVIMGLLSLNYIELSAAYPKAGGMARFAELTHGPLTGFISAWAGWISIIAIIPVEALATTQYLSSLPVHWTKYLYLHDHLHLSFYGILFCWLLIIIYFLINFWSAKVFIRVISVTSFIKFSVPLLTIIALYATSFHWHAITSPPEGFMPYGIEHVFIAVTASGILFSFHGLQTPINLAEESKEHHHALPRAIFMAIGASFVIYFLLQVVFIGSVSPKLLQHGWKHLQFHSPFIDLAMAVNLNWLVFLIYTDSIVSPTGTAITYTATSSRMLLGLQHNGYLPYLTGERHPIYDVSRSSMWINLLVSAALVLFFKSWLNLVDVISVSIVICYITGPVSVMALRKFTTDAFLPFKVRWLKLISPASFILVSFVLYWARWPLSGETIFIILLGMPVYAYYHYHHKKPLQQALRASLWIIFYFITIFSISYCGGSDFGGLGLLSDPEAYLLICVAASIAYYFGVKSGWETAAMKEFIKQKKLQAIK